MTIHLYYGLTREDFNAKFKAAHYGVTTWPVYPTRHGGASHGLSEPASNARFKIDESDSRQVSE